MTKYPIRNSVHMLSFRISIKLNKSVVLRHYINPIIIII
jgi:hypothetical protein